MLLILRSSLLLVVLILFGCTKPSSNQDTDLAKVKAPAEDIVVDVMVLKRHSFAQQFISNGKLTASKKSDLAFGMAGIIKELPFKNGDRVLKGQTLAQLDQTEAHQSLRKAKTNFTKVKMELQDMLIGQGYDVDSIVPKDIYDAAAVRSGFIVAQQDLSDAEYQLSQTILKAPFKGVIANLKQNSYESLNTSEPFCTVIDASKFNVDFQLIESEAVQVKLGDSVKVLPNASNSPIHGVISEINPVVDEFGLVKLKASLKNTGLLLEGMNVKVIVEKYISDQLVVPKTAVVLRQNQEVLFKYTGGIAYWTYVNTHLENSTSFALTANKDKGALLEPGDTVIISNNLNLAHESAVVIR